MTKATTDTSERYTPYTVVHATVSCARPASRPSTVLELAALVNLAILLVRRLRFRDRRSPLGRKLAAFFALIATLVHVGPSQPWRWSGLPGTWARSGSGWPWPSTLTTGTRAASRRWALLRYDHVGVRRWWLTIVGVGDGNRRALAPVHRRLRPALMLLTLVVHCRLLTATDRVIPLLVMAGRARRRARRRAWPYYPFLELGSKGNPAYSGVMDAMYQHPWWRVITTVPGFVVVIQRFRCATTRTRSRSCCSAAARCISSVPSPTSTASAARCR